MDLGIILVVVISLLSIIGMGSVIMSFIFDKEHVTKPKPKLVMVDIIDDDDNDTQDSIEVYDNEEASVIIEI